MDKELKSSLRDILEGVSSLEDAATILIYKMPELLDKYGVEDKGLTLIPQDFCYIHAMAKRSREAIEKYLSENIQKLDTSESKRL